MAAIHVNNIDILGSNLRTYNDLIQYRSALQAATAATGGQVLNGVDFREHSFNITNSGTMPSYVAPGAAKPVDTATVGVGKLQVEFVAIFKQIGKDMEIGQDLNSLANTILSSAAPQFPKAFDQRFLGRIVAGANVTSVEFDATSAGSATQSLSNFVAAYDDTNYEADAVIWTAAGARKLGFTVDADGRVIQGSGVSGGLGGLLGLPEFTTRGLTGTNLGSATLMGVVGPFGAGYVANAMGLMVERMEQATIDGVGPRENIVNYRLEAANGYANGVDYDNTGRGFTILVDAL